jgi:hypothetical protein
MYENEKMRIMLTFSCLLQKRQSFLATREKRDKKEIHFGKIFG